MLAPCLCVVGACTTAVDLPEPSAANRVRSECGRMGDPDYYFEGDIIEPANSLNDSVLRETYDRFLGAIQAPSLSCVSDIRDAYRLLWLPSYRPAVVIQVIRKGYTWHMSGTIFGDPRGGTRLTEIVRRLETDVSDAQIQGFRSLLKDAKVWSAPSWQESTVQDGAICVVEIKVGTGYRVLTRSNPSDPAFKRASAEFFHIAGLTVPAPLQ
jgi:hypothetical protein